MSFYPHLRLDPGTYLVVGDADPGHTGDLDGDVVAAEGVQFLLRIDETFQEVTGVVPSARRRHHGRRVVRRLPRRLQRRPLCWGQRGG